MLVKPAPGLVVRDPATMQLVPESGLEVRETDLFWARALMDGDVTVVEPAAAEKGEPAPVHPAKSVRPTKGASLETVAQ